MQLESKAELVKKLDEHECRFNCSSSAPVDFLISCADEFKAYLLNILEESKKQKETIEEPKIESQE